MLQRGQLKEKEVKREMEVEKEMWSIPVTIE